MRLTHPEYIQLVFGTYQLLRSTPEFSPALKRPTPASIRKECLTVYKERPGKKDEAILRSFFGPVAENKSFSNLIENFPTVGFKAFSNYLKGKAVNTDDKNVELLAWLIDFPHRPYRYGMDIVLSDKEKEILKSGEIASENVSPDIEEEKEDKSENKSGTLLPNELEHTTTPTAEEQVPVFPINSVSETRPVKKGLMENKQWLTVGIALFFSILSLGAYLLYNKGENCMYWTGDHYEKIDCDADINDKILINEERWKNFRKITRPDTITAWSIGKIYYLKNNRALEYFTAAGNHPVYVTRTLKVLSPYMFNKYVQKKDAGVDSSAESQTKSLTNR